MTETKPKRRIRRYLLFAFPLLVIVLGVAAWQIAERVLAVDQYRPRVEQEIARYAGLPVSIQSFDLQLRPFPLFTAENVVIGDADFRATARRVKAYPELRSLLDGRLNITSITVEGLQSLMPDNPDQFQSRWQNLIDTIKSEMEKKRGASPEDASVRNWLSIAEIIAGDARLHFGSEGANTLYAEVSVHDVLSNTIAIDFDGKLPSHSDSAGARGTVTIQIDPGARKIDSVSGQIELAGFHPNALTELPELLHHEVRATATLESDDLETVRAHITGRAEPRAAHALSGSFESLLEIGADAVAFTNIKLSGPGLQATGEIRFPGDGPHQYRIASADTRGQTLAALLAAFTTSDFELRQRDGAYAEGADILLEVPEGKPLSIAGGRLTFDGLDVRVEDRVVASAAKGTAQYADGHVRVEEVSSDPIAVAGTVQADFGANQYTLDLTGSVNITDEYVKRFGDFEPLSNLHGTVAVERFQGAFPSEDGWPTDFKAVARLEDAELDITIDETGDRFSSVSALLEADHKLATLQLDARSDVIGAVSVSGEYAMQERSLRGTLTADIGRIAPYVGDEDVQQNIDPILAAYGQSDIGYGLELPRNEKEPIRLQLTRADTPRANLNTAWPRVKETYVLGDMSADFAVPAEACRHLVAETVNLDGHAALQFRRSLASRQFVANVVLDSLAITSGEYIEKRAGESVSLAIAGAAGDAEWAADRLSIVVPGQQVKLPIRDNRIDAGQLAVDLEPFSLFLVDSASLSGRVSGDFSTAPLAVDARCEDVAIRFSPDLVLDSINGGVVYREGDWQLRDLHVRGAKSDCIITARKEGGVLRGRISGKAINVNPIQSLVEAARNLIGTHEAPPDADAQPLSGHVDIALDALVYNRAEARRVFANIDIEDGDFLAREVNLSTSAGAINGTVDLLRANDGGPRRLDAKLDIRDVDTPFIAAVFFDEPQGVRGAISGSVRFTAPLEDDPKVMMANAGGTANLTAKDGTFGKLGLATKLLTVLRSSEVLRMKMPAFKDEGLVYDTCTATADMRDGVVTLQKFDLGSKSYALTAKGTVDFAKETTDIPIEFNATRAFTGFVENIPVVGRVGDVFEIVNVRLEAKGSPYEMEFGVASVKDQVVGAGKAGGEVIINNVKDLVNIFRKNRDNTDPEQ